jgi:MFS family permease
VSSLAVLRDREFLALSGTAFARAQAYSTIAIALALYADAFGTTSTVEGLFGTAFAVVQLVIVLPLGRYVDTHSAKRVLLAGLALNVGVFVAYTFVTDATGVVLVRMLQGVGASVLWVGGSTVVGEVAPDAERGQWLGTYNQVGAFSSLAGDVVGGLVLELYGFTVTYALLSGVTILAGLLTLRFLRDNPGGRTDPEEATGVETLGRLLGCGPVRALVVFRLGLSFGKMVVVTFLPIYARTAFGMPAFLIGAVLAGGKLTKALTQGTVGGLTDRVGRKQYFVIAGALTYALGTAMVPLAAFADGVVPTVVLGGVTVVPAAFVLFLAYGVCGIADSIRLPASMALFVEEGEQFDAVGGSLSLRSVAWKVGQVAGPVTVGAVWDLTSAMVAFLTAAGCIAFATVVFVLLYSAGVEAGARPAAGD